LTKEEDEHLASIKSVDDDVLRRSVEALMIIHGEMLKT